MKNIAIPTLMLMAGLQATAVADWCGFGGGAEFGPATGCHRYDWPIVLEWSGFGVRNDRPNVSPTILSDEHSEQLELAFQTMLRRFVDESWIRRRADATVSTH